MIPPLALLALISISTSRINLRSNLLSWTRSTFRVSRRKSRRKLIDPFRLETVKCEPGVLHLLVRSQTLARLGRSRMDAQGLGKLCKPIALMQHPVQVPSIFIGPRWEVYSLRRPLGVLHGIPHSTL